MNLLVNFIDYWITGKNDRKTSEPVIFKHYCNLGNIEIKSNKPKQ